MLDPLVFEYQMHDKWVHLPEEGWKLTTRANNIRRRHADMQNA